MKISFKYQNGKLFAKPYKELKNYILSKDGFDMGLWCVNPRVNQSPSSQRDIWDLLDHKVIYFPVHNEGGYVTLKGFVVRTEEGLKVWHDEYYVIEDGDALFTEVTECMEFCREQNKKTREVTEKLEEDLVFLKILRSVGEDVLKEIDSEITAIESELGKGKEEQA